MAHINLYNIPEIDMSYEHAPYFASKDLQQSWFAAKRRERVEDVKIHMTYSRTEVTVPISFSRIEMMAIDYCTLWTEGDGVENKLKYYFVVDYTYIAEKSTKLTLILDPLQTFMFDINFKPSFVDRCHVRRWTTKGSQKYPTLEVEPEGQEFGEHIALSDHNKPLTTFKDRYLIVASNPLGNLNRSNKKSNVSGGQGGSSDLPSLNCWQSGEMSADGFRFTKGQEGWTATRHQDPGGVPIIAYGITPNYDPKLFNDLVSKQPLSEEFGAKETYKAITTLNKPLLNYFKTAFRVDSQHKFDALADFVFTAGSKWIIGDYSLPNALKKDPNNENFIRPIWEDFIIRDAQGRPQDGLKKRRKAECDIYFGKGYWKKEIDILGTSQTMKTDGWLPECGESGQIPDIDKLKAFKAYGINFVYPLQGGGHKVEGKIGMRKHPISGQWKMHHGDDYGAPYNEKVYATHAGTVMKADGTDVYGYGNWIILQNNTLNIQTYYCHLNAFKVKVGDVVKQGQVIGLVGSTGGSTGPHLHYEFRIPEYTNDKARDPIPNLKKGDIF